MSQAAAWSVFSSAKTRSAAVRDASNPNVLKRNQACHQCRKRKLKCDAKRPCSTCVRSHSNAVAHAPKGSQMPADPECTFDDSTQSEISTSGGVEKSTGGLGDNTFGLDDLSLPNNDNYSSPYDEQLMYGGRSSSELDGSFSVHPSPGTSHFSSAQEVVQMDTAPPISGTYSKFIREPFGLNGPSTAPPMLDMMWPNWPPDLPSPKLLFHLIEVFFTYQMHARRLFHVPTFMESLTLPPSHAKFPITPILHAICAISPMFTPAAIASPSLAGGVFQQGYRITEQNPESFMEQQASLAKETISKYWSSGDRPMQVLQANIILSWYLWNHAKLFDAWDCTGRSLRMISLLNLNTCPQFESVAADDFIGLVLLPPAESWIEEEMRRNVFWLAYAMDRTTSLGSAFGIDNNDLGQYFPVRGDLFDNGGQASVDNRQWAHTENVLLVHPEDQCDSFTIFIKGTMLITHVRNFNHRFRINHHASNSKFMFFGGLDPRETQAFQELDKTLSQFRRSFPPSLRNPINGNVLDRHLYSASLCMCTAIILLHEPYADARNPECISSVKMLAAARNTLDLIYMIWSTSYDITLLDLSCALSWYLAGRVFTRSLQIAIETNSQDQISILRTELAFIQLAIKKVGERIPLAREHGKVLHLLAVRLCGASYADPLSVSLTT